MGGFRTCGPLLEHPSLAQGQIVGIAALQPALGGFRDKTRMSGDI